jgi:hypothetical protein
MYDNIIKPEDVIIRVYSPERYSSWSWAAPICVSIYHKPTGITVKSESERTQHRNRHVALMELCEKVYKYEEALCWQEYGGKVHE